MTPGSVVTSRNRALLDWFAAFARDLPWRGAPDPYATLVSETMLQQTQVDRVIPHFESFMGRWPTVETLAAADRPAVLAAWSGLGYNTRAVRLHEASRIIAQSGWPTTIEGLQHLPGVGPYTAGAIAAIAFGQDVPAVDTNLRRVLGRWRGAPLGGTHLSAYAAEVLGSPAGAWNQAVMDLGAAVCRPRSPRCEACPVAKWCADPTVYEAPPRQAPFEGSNRQLRGAVVKAHLAGEDVLAAGLALGHEPGDVLRTVDDLASEGLLPTVEPLDLTS
jgi:A/G-specific adenine glycosylase